MDPSLSCITVVNGVGLFLSLFVFHCEELNPTKFYM